MNQPLWLEHTGRSLLAESLDGNGGGGFRIDTLPTDSIQGGTEIYNPVHYELRSIRVRSPGLHAGKPTIAGTTESSQVLEMALIHREKLRNGQDGNWAVVYIPFVQADTPLKDDPLLAFIEDADFPTQKGQVGHAQLRLPWNVEHLMPVDAMLHYWGNLVAPPCGPDVLARHFVRQEPVQVAAATLAPILAVLGRAAENAGFMIPSPPTSVWKVPTCYAGVEQLCGPILQKGAGYAATKTDLDNEMKAATIERTAARNNLVQKQQQLNASLVQLRGSGGTNAEQKQSGGQLVTAQHLAAELHAAEERMEAARLVEANALADLQALPNSTFEWDLGRPEKTLSDSDSESSAAAGKASLFGSEFDAHLANATHETGDGPGGIPLKPPPEDATPAKAEDEGMSLLNLVLGTEDSEQSEASESSTNSEAFSESALTGTQSCAQWHGNGASGGLSPIDIRTADIADLQALAQVNSSPVMVRYDGDLGEGSLRRLWLENTGGSLRATALPTDNAAPGGPLGIMSLGSAGLFDLKTIELKMPGEHRIDGSAPVAELQLIHHRQGADEVKPEPVAILALRLNVAEDDADNPWLDALMNTLPHMDEATEVYGAPLWSAAAGFSASDEVPSYYRYDGATTSPPCRAAQWFMLEDPGFISARQLNALKLVLMPKPSPLMQPLGERIVVRDSPLALEKKSAKALLQALRQRRLRSTSSRLAL